MNSNQYRGCFSGLRRLAASGALALAVVLVPVVVTAGSVQAQQVEKFSFTVLDTFNQANGIAPQPLLGDAKGNLYGTTFSGGTSTNCPTRDANGCGTVFKVDPAGKLTTLYSFTGESDGKYPIGRLVRDAKGNLYGVTFFGGVGNGTVFKLDPADRLTTLYSFTDGLDGALPDGGLVRDAKGNLYGTAFYGGASNDGTVFKLNPAGKLTTLYSFAGGTDGAEPQGGLVQDAAGNLYGTTVTGGGSSNCTNGCGTVFKVSKTGKETVLYSFTGEADGGIPENVDLVRDTAGNLYGTTFSGGGGSCTPDNATGCGVVFKLDVSGKETVLYSFTGGRNGGNPEGGVVLDDKGNIYGTTAFYGGHSSANCIDEYQKLDGCGVVFKLDTTGKESVLHRFTSGSDGNDPISTLLRDTKGNLYGNTSTGGDLNCQNGHGCGVVFKVVP
jgi:uncharacterized repeat protein (TIGR03803 family)